jgi:hypothetical protein
VNVAPVASVDVIEGTLPSQAFHYASKRRADSYPLR